MLCLVDGVVVGVVEYAMSVVAVRTRVAVPILRRILSHQKGKKVNMSCDVPPLAGGIDFVAMVCMLREWRWRFSILALSRDQRLIYGNSQILHYSHAC